MAAKFSVHLVITLLVFAALIGSMIVQPAPAHAATWYVATAANGGNDANDGSAAHPWEHINYAIGKASAGDTIHIGIGWFFEQVEITKPLTLIGTAVAPTPNGTFIAAPDTANRTAYPAPGGVLYDYVVVAHDNTSISIGTLTIVARGTMIVGADNYVSLVFDNVTGAGSGFNAGCISGESNNNIADADICVTGGSNVTVQESQLVDFTGMGVAAIHGSTFTIYHNYICAELDPSVCVGIDTAPSLCLVDSNRLISADNGVIAEDSGSITISNNDISGGTGLGIGIGNCTGPVLIQHNEISNFGQGIHDGGIVTGSIVNNEIYDCGTAIWLENAGSTWTALTDNLIYDCTTLGLNHTCALDNVAGNIFYNDVIGIQAHNDLVAHCNAILGNTTAGLDIQVDGTFNVINNYWGDNSGPNVNGGGPGTGDNILTHGHTLPPIFNPWAAMNLSATPAAIVADGASLSTLDLDCTRNSNGDVMGCNIPDGFPVHFTTTAGTLTNATVPTSGGHAITDLRSSTTSEIATVSSAFQAAPGLTISTADVNFIAPPTVTTGTGVYVSPSWFYLTGNLTGLGSADISVTPYIDYWGPVDGSWTLATMTSAGSFSTPATLQTPPGAMPAGTYTFRAKVQGNQSGIWAYGDTVTFIFQPPPQQLGINAGAGSHGSSLPTLTTPGTTLNLPNVQVTSARLSASSIAAGSPVTVTADVTNMGVSNGTALVRVYLNSEVAASQGVNVASGSITPVTFTVTPSRPGEYSVRVNNVPAGTLKVKDVNDSDIIFAIAFAAFVLIFAALIIVYLRQRRMAV